MTRTTRLRFARAALRPPVRARRAFTLIELLVVLAIIGILLALSAAALQKTVEGQKRKSTQDQVFKLQQALDQEYDRVVQRCAKEAEQQQIPPEVLTVCDNDLARAKAVWTAFQIRLNFPETFTEANTTLTIVDATGTPRFQIKRPATFDPVAGLAGDATRPQEESGVLLYMILARRSVSGGGAMAEAADDVTQAARRKATFGGREFETFSDAFQNSVGFKRWAKHWPLPTTTTDLEIQSSPFVDPQKLARSPNGGVTGAAIANVDPLDPQNRVFGWQLATSDQRRLIRTGLEFDGKNRLITAYSFGRTIRDSAGNLTPLDDILGFRLRQQGARGNKQ